MPTAPDFKEEIRLCRGLCQGGPLSQRWWDESQLPGGRCFAPTWHILARAAHWFTSGLLSVGPCCSLRGALSQGLARLWVARDFTALHHFPGTCLKSWERFNGSHFPLFPHVIMQWGEVTVGLPFGSFLEGIIGFILFYLFIFVPFLFFL